ncbi:hypothetical protein HDU96_000050 [Phlyctochytrium bullatum]|nr:hypothetical protein HDU96_000050 [Phlyctochytrium bullatum]
MPAPAIRTQLTDLVGIHCPLVCPPMAGACNPELVAAVARAGGLGFVAGAYKTDPDALRKEVSEAKRLARGKPVGVGFITWFLDKHPEMLDAALAADPAAVWFSFGDPTPHIRRLRAFDDRRLSDLPLSSASTSASGEPVLRPMIVFCQIRTVAEAVLAADAGADVVVAQAVGAGGHGERVGAGLMALVPEVVDEVGERCVVVAAGGVSDGRGLAASLLLGASGVAMGTRFCASNESSFSARAKRLLAATADGGVSTVRVRTYERLRGLDWPAPYDFRVYRNELVRDVMGRQAARGAGPVNAADDEEAVESWRKKFEEALAASGGDVEVGYVAMGEGVGLVRGVWSAERIVERVMEEAVDLLAVGAAAVRVAKPKL